jgi:ribonuclease HI
MRVPMPWQKMYFRNDPVWVHVDGEGRPTLDAEGRAEMKYRESDTKTYRPVPANLSSTDGASAAAPPGHEPKPGKLPTRATKKSTTRTGSARPTPPGTHDGPGLHHGAGSRDPRDLQVWTDGACSGNPGPMGIGVVLIDGAWRDEISEYLGTGTNNIAELVAIERGLESVTNRIASTSQRVRVHSDSGYAIGLLSKGWKAKANQDVVERIRRKLDAFPAAIEFVKVAGHAGVPENERCDELARLAVTRRASGGR